MERPERREVPVGTTNGARRMIEGAIVLVASMALAACGYRGTAIETFSRAQSCPEARVTVIPLDNFHQTMTGAPPAAVAADPERLAVWRATREATEELINYGSVFRVSGCGFGPQIVRCSSNRNGAHCSEIVSGYDDATLTSSGS